MRLTITRPDDWHLHLRDGAALSDIAGHTAEQFKRAIVMPNLKPPVEDISQAEAYRSRIVNATQDSDFIPLMTLYLTPRTTPALVHKAAAHADILAIKLYPAGATTNSDAGVSDLEPLYPVFEAMSDSGLPLLIHGETTAPETDLFDREACFVGELLAPLADRFAQLKIVLEHITTREAASFVVNARAGIAATITPHHLLFNRNALFQGGLRPDYYCLPVLKRESHRQALLEAATSGSSRFFLGTDSAPHKQGAKYSSCGCAGIYSAHAAMPLYAKAFESVQALDKLEHFASLAGPDFYGLARNSGTLTLEKTPWVVPSSYQFANELVTPLCAGEELEWRVTHTS